MRLVAADVAASGPSARDRVPGYRYRLGDEVLDLTTRTLVMGILNRTPDSFYDQGARSSSTPSLRRAEALVARRAPTCSTSAG